MVRHDPDALWRPGFTGTIVYPTVRREAAPHRPRPGRVAVLAMVAIALAVAGAGIVRRGGDGDLVGDPSRPRLPTTAQRQWTVVLDGHDVRAIAAGGDVVVVLATAPPAATLLGFDRRRGSSRWETPVTTDRWTNMEIVDGTAVVSSTDGGGAWSLTGIDVDDGRQLWSRRLPPDSWFSIDAGQLVVTRTRRLEQLDPRTGDVVAAVAGDVLWGPSAIQRRVGDRLELFDRRTFELRAAVDLRAVGLGDALVVRGVTVGDRALVAGDGVVVLVDGDGAVRTTLTLDAERNVSLGVRLDVLGPGGDLVAVQHGDRLSVLGIEGATLRPLWRESAWVIDATADGSLLGLATVNGSVVAMPTVVDARTGRSAWDGAAALQPEMVQRLFADGGFVAVREAPDEAIVGYDLARTELWQLPSADVDRVFLVDRAVVLVDRGRAAGQTDLTLYGGR